MNIIRILKKIKNGILYFAIIFAYYFISPFAMIICRLNKIWLVTEINYDARDNGFVFFKYVRNNAPNQRIAYVISRNNVNYKKVKKIGRTVEPCSFFHFFLFAGSKIHISTIVNGCCPFYLLRKYLKKHKAFGKQINLKHGIYKDYSPMDLKKNAMCDLIFCGGLPEYNYILDKYGYTKNEVKYTGLARFDELNNTTPMNQLLIMPTWRHWLDGITLEEFKSSTFFKMWSMFLRSDVINNLATKYSVLFFIHPKMNVFAKAFSDISNNITICDSTTHNLGTIIRDSIGCITDFSSVFFDFAYMNRVTIYYQFDEEEFFNNHYEKTYFDYRKNGFGPVATTLDELLSIVLAFEKCGFKYAEYYKKRSDSFFTLKDKNNCERIFNEIVKIDEKKK